MQNEIEINETHLIVLKRNFHDEGVTIDYLPIINPMSNLLDDVYKKCKDKFSHIEYPDEILNSDKNLRDVFLSDYDFCDEISRPYQDLDNLSRVRFEYDSDLSKQKIEKEVLKDKKWLKDELELRDLAFALELVYEKAEDDSSIVSMSHRRLGWAEEPYSLTKNLDVQFLTNFGFGRSSYFYAKLRFKNIDIIPFSEWVRYRNTNYDQIMRYSQSYELKNQNWKAAMEFVRDAVNLCVEDEVEFIQKYIATECKWLVKGLKEISNIDERSDANNFEDKRDRLDYEGEKISGALDFIKSIAEYEAIISVKEFINDIEQLNKNVLPTLYNELRKNNHDLNLAKDHLAKLKPEYDRVTRSFLPLKKLRIRISKIKNPVVSMNVQTLFEIKYREILDKHKEITGKYYGIMTLIRNLEQYEKSFNRYISKIDKYFLQVIEVKFSPMLSIKKNYSVIAPLDAD